MSNTNPLSFLLNSTMATLLNQTQSSLNLNTTQTSLKSVTNNTTVSSVLNITLPYNNSSYPNGNSPWNFNNTIYWNNTIFDPPVSNPSCLGCFATIDPPIITYTYTSTYWYCLLILLLLAVVIICIKIGTSRFKENERRAAAQRRRVIQQSQTVNTPYNGNINDTPNTGNISPKDFDLPPAYNEIIQFKQQQPSTGNQIVASTTMTTNPSSNTISTAISTLTIETEISNSNSNIPSTSSIMTETTVINNAQVNEPQPSTSSEPPSYDHVILEESNKTKTNNFHIV